MDDSISRQAAIDVFEDTTYTKNEIRRRLSELQSAQPERRWILCSERLPEPTPEYEILCCDTRGSYLVAIPFADEGSDTGYSAESDGCYMYNCIAWMPCPKPYKKG